MGTPYNGADNFPVSVTIPSDGDNDEAATFNPAYEGLADRTVWLKNRTGGWRVINRETFKTIDYTMTSWNGWNAITGAFNTANSFLLCTLANNPAVGDIVHVEFQSNFQGLANAATGGLYIFACRIEFSENGGAITPFGADGLLRDTLGAGEFDGESVTLADDRTVAAAGAFNIYVNATRLSGPATQQTLQFSGTRVTTITTWRAN
jgi:hypothetical protein